jgi:hypothetical protein
MRAGTVTATRSDDRFTVFPMCCSATARSRVRTVEQDCNAEYNPSSGPNLCKRFVHQQAPKWISS